MNVQRVTSGRVKSLPAVLITSQCRMTLAVVICQPDGLAAALLMLCEHAHSFFVCPFALFWRFSNFICSFLLFLTLGMTHFDSFVVCVSSLL